MDTPHPVGDNDQSIEPFALGDFTSQEALVQSLYPELKRLAYSMMRRERSDHTLQATAVVSELYLRLLRHPDFRWKDRNHFLRWASRAMHHILVDYAREKNAKRRGQGWVRFELDQNGDAVTTLNPEQILDLDVALRKLEEVEPRMAQTVEMRFFGGLTFAEIGTVLEISERTAKRDWFLARIWLNKQLAGVDDDSGGMGEDQGAL